MNFIKKIIKSFVPFGLVMLYRKYRLSNKTENEYLLNKIEQEERIKKIAELYTNTSEKKNIFEIDDYLYYESLIYKLTKQIGLDEFQVRQGSMPFQSLFEIDKVIKENYRNKKINLLHIGNFVGVSLTFLSRSVLKYADKNSLIISIDPNITHRGIDNPMNIVNKILADDGLDHNSLILCGYSLRKSISNDGQNYKTSYDPIIEYNNEFAPQNTIVNLSKLCQNFIDIVVIDGNHEVEYLRNEIDQIKLLLKKNSLVILDDIDPDNWKDLYDLYTGLDKKYFIKIFENSRIAIMKYNFEVQ